MDTKAKRKLLLGTLNLFDKQESAKFDQERKETNQKLVDILQKLVNEHPSQRFGQILQNYEFVKYSQSMWENEFYAEPQDVLKRVEQRIKDHEDSKT